MCGIAGTFNSTPNAKVIECLKTHINQRGPDDFGVWTSQDDMVTLVHTRLSVIDLTSAGKQPMRSLNGRYLISFNGEIYNHNIIRRQLTSEFKIQWRGHSDTEVLANAIELYGFNKAINLFNGMFAIAAWDTKDKNLYLARDRVGEKPLYVGWNSNDEILFSSELNSIAKQENFIEKLNPEAIESLFRVGYIPAPLSIYEHLFKIPPGHYLKLQSGTVKNVSNVEEFAKLCTPYFSICELAGQNKLTSKDQDIQFQLHCLLKKSTELRMESDVPLGAFLSGGIDSSLITAIMQSMSSSPIKTFCIGFEEKEYDESAHAREVASILGTKHTTLYVTPSDALGVVESLPSIFQEPFADASQIPTYLLCKLAKQHVTVALTGDGGDELFFGYGRYFEAKRMWMYMKMLPTFSRKALASVLLNTPTSRWDSIFRLFRSNINMPGSRIHRFAKRINGSGVNDFHRMFRSHWLDNENLVNGTKLRNKSTFLASNSSIIGREKEAILMLDDQLDYLPEDVLVKVDRASMNVALETRIPFLDHDLLEFSWKIPMKCKVSNGQGKSILRKILEEYIPSKIFERPKQGFGVPISSWLRCELRDWAEWLLSEQELERSGLLNTIPIRNAWKEHINGHDLGQPIWNVLMFQAWLQKNHS